MADGLGSRAMIRSKTWKEMHTAHRELVITMPYHVPNEAMQAALL